MATRSFIGKLNKDNSITGIYCHWDGYPEHAGRILIDNYLTEQQVDQLLALGDLSCIDPALDKCESYASRGEKGVEAKSYKDLQAFYEAGRGSWVEYFYVFNYDFWACWDSNMKRFDLNTLDSEKDEEAA